MLSYMRRLGRGNGGGAATGERGSTSRMPNGAGTNWAAATADKATQAVAHVAGAAKAVAAVPKDLVAGAVRTGFEGATRRLRELIEKIVQIASFFSAAASLLVTGLFLSVGSEFATVVDRASTLTSIALLAGTFTMLRVVVNVLPALLADSDAASGTNADPRSKTRLTAQTTANAIVILVFVLVIIGPVYGTAFLLLLLVGWVLFRRRAVAARLTAGLVACLCLGFLRGEYLRDQPPSLLLVEQGRSTPITVIMSADRGVLIFADGGENARFVTWERVESLTDPRPSRWRLRNAVAPVKSWLDGLAGQYSR